MQPRQKPLKGQGSIRNKCVLVALALLCKVVTIVQLRAHVQARLQAPEIAADSPAIWPARPIAPVTYAFEESVHYELDSPASDAEWSLLAPNDGLIHLRVGDDSGSDQPFSISMFHELRCLDIVRQGIVQTIRGNVTLPEQLVQHCLNYIRLMIFCRSSTMLNGFVQTSDAHKPRTLLGVHECSDWTEIYKEVEMNQEEHQRWIATAS